MGPCPGGSQKHAALICYLRQAERSINNYDASADMAEGGAQGTNLGERAPHSGYERCVSSHVPCDRAIELIMVKLEAHTQEIPKEKHRKNQKESKIGQKEQGWILLDPHSN